MFEYKYELALTLAEQQTSRITEELPKTLCQGEFESVIIQMQ